MINDINRINSATDHDRVARLRWLRAYWIANFKDMDYTDKELLSGYIYQTRAEVDLQRGKHALQTR